MDIANHNVLKFELMLGQITYICPERGICLIQPLDKVLGAGDAATLGGAGRVSCAAVRESTIYSVNDFVLYARSARTGIFSPSVMDVAVVICRAPAYLDGYSDVTEMRKDASGDFHDYYDVIHKLSAGLVLPDEEFINRTWLEARMGGDKLLEGKNVVLRVSDELIQILGRRCGLHVNSVDSSVAAHGIHTVKIS